VKIAAFNRCKRLLTLFFYYEKLCGILNGGLPLAGTIHFKPLRIFTEKTGRNAKPAVNRQACARAHAYHGGLFFHVVCSMGVQG